MAFNFENIFVYLQQYGFYDFVLPFLLLFAVIFGILTYMKLFKDQKAVQVLIALVFGLLATRFPFYTDFVNFISPRLGVAIMILLLLLILIGLFTPERSGAIIGWISIAIAVIMVLVILGQASDFFDFFGGGSYFTDELVGGLIFVALMIGVIVAIVTASSSKRSGLNNTVDSVATKLKSLFE